MRGRPQSCARCKQPLSRKGRLTRPSRQVSPACLPSNSSCAGGQWPLASAHGGAPTGCLGHGHWPVHEAFAGVLSGRTWPSGQRRWALTALKAARSGHRGPGLRAIAAERSKRRMYSAWGGWWEEYGKAKRFLKGRVGRLLGRLPGTPRHAGPPLRAQKCHIPACLPPSPSLTHRHRLAHRRRLIRPPGGGPAGAACRGLRARQGSSARRLCRRKGAARPRRLPLQVGLRGCGGWLGLVGCCVPWLAPQPLGG